MSTTCLACKAEISGRSDKKFCDLYCKNEFHNRKGKSSKPIYFEELFKLKKNRRILRQYFEMGRLEPDYDELLKKGFNFRALTGIDILASEPRVFYCFDYSIELAERSVRISKGI